MWISITYRGLHRILIRIILVNWIMKFLLLKYIYNLCHCSPQLIYLQRYISTIKKRIQQIRDLASSSFQKRIIPIRKEIQIHYFRSIVDVRHACLFRRLLSQFSLHQFILLIFKCRFIYFPSSR